MLEVLTRREPGGILLLCSGDVAAAAARVAASTGLKVLPASRRAPDLLHLTRPGERCVTLISMASGDIEGALARSSFSVLGMAADLADPGALIDPLGALDDLERGALVARAPVGDDPERLLLAPRLAGEYGLEPDEDTMAALRSNAFLAEEIEPRRAWAGLSRIFDAVGFSGAASFLKETGVLDHLIPCMADIYEVPQNYYHHLGVWDHTMACLDNLEEMLRDPRVQFKAYGDRVAAHLTRRVEGGVRRRSLRALAALVHDAGKAASMSVEPSGRIRFQGHQLEGAKLAAPIAARFGLGSRASRDLVAIVRDHMRLGFLLRDGETTAGRLRAATELCSICPEVVLLSLADRMATRDEASTDEALQRFKRLAARLLADWFWLRDNPPLLGGEDIIVHGGLEEGPAVGEALARVRVAQRESIASSRAQALEFLAPDFKGKMDVRGNEGGAR